MKIKLGQSFRRRRRQVEQPEGQFKFAHVSGADSVRETVGCILDLAIEALPTLPEGVYARLAAVGCPFFPTPLMPFVSPRSACDRTTAGLLFSMRKYCIVRRILAQDFDCVTL